MMIKAFTVYQPWASLIMIGAKPYEFRRWSFMVRKVGIAPGERIGIHAAARPVKPAEVLDIRNRLDDPLQSTGMIADKARALIDRLLQAPKCQGVIDTSALLGTVAIGEPVLSTDLFPQWRGLVNDSDRLEHCKWAWPMNDPRQIVTKPMNGAQGFFWASIDQAAI